MSMPVRRNRLYVAAQQHLQEIRADYRKARKPLIALGVLTWLIVFSFEPGVVLFWTVVAGVGVALLVRHQRQVEIERRNQAIYAARAREISSYLLMSPREFEYAVAYLCERDGCTSVQVVGGRGDLGADVKAVAPDGRRIVIQCKRYGPANKVGSGDMQKFGGTCYNVHGAQVAALVTTSTFTRDAAAYGAGMRIGLYDVDMLAGWASRTGPPPWM